MDATLHSDLVYVDVFHCTHTYVLYVVMCTYKYEGLTIPHSSYCSHTHSTHHLHLTQRVELRFHPHPNDSSVSSLGMRVLSTTPATTVGHLVKYLVVRNALQRKEREGTGWHLTVFVTPCVACLPLNMGCQVPCVL